MNHSHRARRTNHESELSNDARACNNGEDNVIASVMMWAAPEIVDYEKYGPRI